MLFLYLYGNQQVKCLGFFCFIQVYVILLTQKIGVTSITLCTDVTWNIRSTATSGLPVRQARLNKSVVRVFTFTLRTRLIAKDIVANLKMQSVRFDVNKYTCTAGILKKRFNGVPFGMHTEIDDEERLSRHTSIGSHFYIYEFNLESSYRQRTFIKKETKLITLQMMNI